MEIERDILEELKNQKNGVCIYGFGTNGTKTFVDLKGYGIDNIFFADRDESKSNIQIAGVRCIGYEEFCEQNKDVYVIVAIEAPKRIMESIRKAGFCNVHSFIDVRKELKMFPEKYKFKPISSIAEAVELKNELYEWLVKGNVIYSEEKI